MRKSDYDTFFFNTIGLRISYNSVSQLFMVRGIGLDRGPKEDMSPQISGISCRPVLRDTVPQTKYYCSLRFKTFAPSQNFGQATLLIRGPLSETLNTHGLHHQ